MRTTVPRRRLCPAPCETACVLGINQPAVTIKQVEVEIIDRAWEEGCLINDKVFQIGLRGTGYSPEDFNWGRDKGWTVIQAEACWYKSLAPMMAETRAKLKEELHQALVASCGATE